MPRGRDVMRLAADDGFAVERNFALRRLINAGDKIEHRRLARAIRADEPDQFVAPDLQIQFRHRRQSAEADGGFVELEQRRHELKIKNTKIAIRLKIRFFHFLF